MSHAGKSVVGVKRSRHVALASCGLSALSVVLFLLGGVTSGKSIGFSYACCGLALLAGIGSIAIARGGPRPRSSLPAFAVSLSLVLLVGYVASLLYIGSQLRNFWDQ